MGRVARFLGLTLLAFGLASGLVTALPLDATIAPTATLEIAGTIGIGNADGESFISKWDSSAGKPSLEGQRWLVTIREITWTSGLTGPLENADQLHQSHRQLDASMLRVDARGLGTWLVHPIGPSATSLSVSSSACKVWMGSPENATLAPGLLGVIDSKVPARLEAPALHHDCAAASQTVRGPMRILIFGPAVELQFQNRDTESAVRETIESGLSETRPFPSAGTLLHRYAEIALTTTDPMAKAVFPVGQSVHLQSGSSHVEGRVHLPGAAGSVSWGETHKTPAKMMAPEGKFDVRAQAGGIVVRGDATSGFRAAAVGAGVAGLGWAAWRWGAGFFSLFSRVRDDELLANPRRLAVLSAIVQNPGIHPRGIARILGLARRSVEYHTAILARRGVVLGRRFGRTHAFFPLTIGSALEQERLFLSRQDSVNRILSVLRRRRGTSQADLVRILQLSQARISELLARLQRLGLVTVDGTPKRKRYSIAD